MIRTLKVNVLGNFAHPSMPGRKVCRTMLKGSNYQLTSKAFLSGNILHINNIWAKLCYFTKITVGAILPQLEYLDFHDLIEGRFELRRIHGFMAGFHMRGRLVLRRLMRIQWWITLKVNHNETCICKWVGSLRWCSPIVTCKLPEKYCVHVE